MLLIKISIQVIQSQSISILSRTLESKYMSGSKAVMPRFKKKSDSPKDAKCISNQQTKSLSEYCKSQTWQQSRLRRCIMCVGKVKLKGRGINIRTKISSHFLKNKDSGIDANRNSSQFQKCSTKTTVRFWIKESIMLIFVFCNTAEP